MSTTRTRKFLAASAAVTAASLPIALATATPAEATTSRGGCSVTPLRPSRSDVWVIKNGLLRLEKRIKYSTRVTCVKDRIVQIAGRQYEQDAPAGLAGDDFQGTYLKTLTFASAGSVTWSAYRNAIAVDTEPGSDEYYHRVHFKVASINGVSAWTLYENSPVFVAPAV